VPTRSADLTPPRIPPRDRAGYTLTEVLVVIAILAIALNATAIIFSHALKSYATATSQEDTAASAGIAMVRIERDIRAARAASVEGNTLTLVFDGAPPATWALDDGHLTRASGDVKGTYGRDIAGLRVRTAGRFVEVSIELRPVVDARDVLYGGAAMRGR
jgi:prepilin-type N-terminal cleavage/methylation domain-containing protein